MKKYPSPCAVTRQTPAQEGKVVAYCRLTGDVMSTASTGIFFTIAAIFSNLVCSIYYSSLSRNDIPVMISLISNILPFYARMAGSSPRARA